MGVDDLRGAPRVFGVDLGGDEHRLVAEGPCVEDRGDLTNDPLLEQPPHAEERLVLAHLRRARDLGVGSRGDGEAALHEVEQPPVEIVERDGGAVPAAAQLGPEPGTGRL